MFSVVLLSLAAMVVAGEPPLEVSGKVAGGTPIGANVRPYLVGILPDLGNNRRLNCGGSMLSNTKTLTAAHCVKRSRDKEATKLTLVFGTDNVFFGGKRVETSAVDIHPEFNVETGNNDIAMVTHEFVEYSDTIKPISLPSGDLLQDNFLGKWATIVGFRYAFDAEGEITNSSNKYEVSLQVISNEVCAETYGSSVIIESSLCLNTTSGPRPCDGDSGGPLTITSDGQDVLIGVFSITCEDGCSKGFPAGFSRISSFISWIKEKL